MITAHRPLVRHSFSHQGRPPLEDLATRENQIQDIDHRKNIAVTLVDTADGRCQDEHDDQKQRTHHPVYSLGDALHVLLDGREPVLAGVDYPGQRHRQEHVLHVRAERVRDRGGGLVLLSHEDGRDRVGERGADCANRDAQERIRQRGYVVVNLLRDLEHQVREHGKPEHRPCEAQRPAALPPLVLDVDREEGALQHKVNQKVRDGEQLVGQLRIFGNHRVPEVLDRTFDGGIVRVKV
mmetsp:Transcript_65048/g.169230  ORF Transcript_65048/g.169230 Transcript_65048/m.169230 type:complete len:238 (+) Transcript_65048:129-842(+)